MPSLFSWKNVDGSEEVALDIDPNFYSVGGARKDNSYVHTSPPSWIGVPPNAILLPPRTIVCNPGNIEKGSELTVSGTIYIWETYLDLLAKIDSGALQIYHDPYANKGVGKDYTVSLKGDFNPVYINGTLNSTQTPMNYTITMIIQ